MQPKTIKIFLAEGDPTGLKIAELSNWTGQAIVVPRNKLKEIKSRKEAGKPSVYFLVGKNGLDENKPLLYIGEAENFGSRLVEHDASKDFWQTAIGFSSKDDNLTKAHVRYLESICMASAKKSNRCKLMNGTDSSQPNLPESDLADLVEFLTNLRVLFSTLGYPFLEPLISKESVDPENPIFYCKGKGAEATGRMTNDGFIVYKDSTATTHHSLAGTKQLPGLIQKLLDNQYIKKQNEDNYLFLKDYVFNSPSAASDLILGNSSNGWEKWKATNGETLSKIYRNKANADSLSAV